MSPGCARANDTRQRQKAAGMAAAIAWRESRRCVHCRALAYVPCVHRPDGFGSVAAVDLPAEWPVVSRWER